VPQNEEQPLSKGQKKRLAQKRAAMRKMIEDQERQDKEKAERDAAKVRIQNAIAEKKKERSVMNLPVNPQTNQKMDRKALKQVGKIMKTKTQPYDYLLSGMGIDPLVIPMLSEEIRKDVAAGKLNSDKEIAENIVQMLQSDRGKKIPTIPGTDARKIQELPPGAQINLNFGPPPASSSS
jgi:hypothetical protein